MGGEKSALAGSAAMLILKLLEERDMYGYQMIEELRRRSDHTFDLKAGTLYPLLHGLEEKGWIASYQDNSDTARPRKYYHLTKSGAGQLKEKQEEWQRYSRAVDRVLEGGVCFG
jgi:PadR family transcriptional regulator PadR